MSLTEQTLKARYMRLIRFLHRTTGKYRELFLIPQTKSGDFISPDTLKKLPTYQVKKKLRSPGVLSIIIEVSDHVVEEARKDLEELQKFEATRKRHTPTYPR